MIREAANLLDPVTGDMIEPIRCINGMWATKIIRGISNEGHRFPAVGDRSEPYDAEYCIGCGESYAGAGIWFHTCEENAIGMNQSRAKTKETR